MLKIGLTGGIGCGKSTVANHFLDLGIPVIDADQIAHNLVTPGQPALQSIVANFGRQLITAEGQLNRKMLKALIFNDLHKKKRLEAILHPLVYSEMKRQLDMLETAYVILCIPLLLETKMQHFVDRILVIDCPSDIQVARVKRRDQITEKRIIAIINTQVSRNQRLAEADDIIVNNDDKSKLAVQIKKLHNLYLSLSES